MVLLRVLQVSKYDRLQDGTHPTHTFSLLQASGRTCGNFEYEPGEHQQDCQPTRVDFRDTPSLKQA
jgi:hypothetical protein